MGSPSRNHLEVEHHKSQLLLSSACLLPVPKALALMPVQGRAGTGTSFYLMLLLLRGGNLCSGRNLIYATSTTISRTAIKLREQSQKCLFPLLLLLQSKTRDLGTEMAQQEKALVAQTQQPEFNPQIPCCKGGT